MLEEVQDNPKELIPEPLRAEDYDEETADTEFLQQKEPEGQYVTVATQEPPQE